MKLSIKALLVSAALIFGMQNSSFAMQANQMSISSEGMRFGAVPALVAHGGEFVRGKFYAFGYVNQAGQKAPAVARFNPDSATLDTTFGTNGLAVAQGAPNSQAWKLEFKNDDGIWVRLQKNGVRAGVVILSPNGIQDPRILE